MPFSEPRYVKCRACGGEGVIKLTDWDLDNGFPEDDDEVNIIEEKPCPLCEGSGKILDEQIPEEDE
jgi:DnaJ-class molecular chaperone